MYLYVCSKCAKKKCKAIFVIISCCLMLCPILHLLTPSSVHTYWFPSPFHRQTTYKYRTPADPGSASCLWSVLRTRPASIRDDGGARWGAVALWLCCLAPALWLLLRSLGDSPTWGFNQQKGPTQLRSHKRGWCLRLAFEHSHGEGSVTPWVPTGQQTKTD